MIDFDKMSMHELREVARVQAHELSKLKTTAFKDEFARRLGLSVVKELQHTPRHLWTEDQARIYNDVAASHSLGARCWRGIV